MPFRRSISTTLSLLVTLCFHAGCKEPFEFETHNKYAYLRPGQPMTLQDILRPIIPNQALVSVAGCDFTPDELEELPSSTLTPIHNALVSGDSLPTNATKEKRWVEKPASTPDTFAGIMLRSVTTSADLQYGAVPAGNTSGKNSSVTFVAVDMHHQVNLTTKAEMCLRSFICSNSAKSGAYYRSVVYGSLVRVKINSGEYTLSLDPSSSIAPLPLRVRVEANLSDFTIDGGFIGGRTRSGADIGRLVDAELISKAIRERDLKSIFNKLSASDSDDKSEPIGIIAAERVLVDCNVSQSRQ